MLSPFCVDDSYKKSPVSSYNKETGLYLHKNLRYHSSCRFHGHSRRSNNRLPLYRSGSVRPTDRKALGQAAQRPVYSFHRDRLAPPGGSLDRAWNLLFPLQSVFCMCGALYHENRKVSSTEIQKCMVRIQKADIGRGHVPAGQFRALSGKRNAQSSILPGGGRPPPYIFFIR